MQMNSFKSRILIPLSLALAILLTGFVVSFYQNQKKHLHAEVINKLESVEKLIVTQLDSDTQTMKAGLEIVLYDKQLQTALKNKDREALLEQALPFFKHLQSKHRITHFYFTGSDRINILRVHKPDKYGDKIDRYTTLAAERSGKFSSGIELGPLGTFTLRVVTPWYEGDRLIGYVEFGEEIEHITKKLRDILNVELYVLIEKKFLNREVWEAGMRMLGRQPAWDQFPTVVMIDNTEKLLPENIIKFFNEAHYTSMQPAVEVSLNDREYRTGFLPLKDVGGNVVGHMVILFDVTDMKSGLHTTIFYVGAICLAVGGVLFVLFHIFLGQIERQMAKSSEALQESEKKYRHLVESTRDWVWSIDIEGRITFTNEAVKHILGYEVHELLGSSSFYPMHPEDQELSQRLFQQVVEQKRGWKNSVVRMIHKDGSVRFFESSAQSIIDAEDRLVGFAGIDRDITDRKRAEKALQDSEEKYRSMMDAINDAVYICSPDFRIEYMNPAMTKRIGYDAAGELCYNVIHGLDEKCPWCIHGKVMQGKHVKNEVVSPKDGKTYFVSSSPVLHTDGSVSKLSISRDITELKKMETQLRQSQKMESIGTLAGGIAHDFNNILFPIVGYAEMMLDDLPEDSLHRKNTNEILQGAKRAKALVKQILTYSRQSDQELQPLNVQLVIKEVLKLIRSSIPTTIEINQDIGTECGYVLADPTQIHQIAMNLMTNAFHAMEDEGGKLEVTLKEVALGIDDLTDQSMTPGAYVCLTVADTGHGMDQAVISRIFDPYFTTKESGKGTGLGLSVVHGIVKSYQGDIKVYSEPGKGTVFHVYLPVIISQVETERADAVAPVPKGTERILLVDDDDPIVRMEKQMLERLGYQVTERTSSIEALEAFRNAPNKFDLVITDMTMPNMTGIQLSQKLLAIRPDIPIIICTGFSTKIDDAKAKEFGIRGFVMKPVIMRELANKIREVLDQEE